jgi:hypothetical protein
MIQQRVRGIAFDAQSVGWLVVQHLDSKVTHRSSNGRHGSPPLTLPTPQSLAGRPPGHTVRASSLTATAAAAATAVAAAATAFPAPRRRRQPQPLGGSAPGRALLPALLCSRQREAHPLAADGGEFVLADVPKGLRGDTGAAQLGGREVGVGWLILLVG